MEHREEAEWSEDDRVELAALLDGRLGPAAVLEPALVRPDPEAQWWQLVAGLLAVLTIPATGVTVVALGPVAGVTVLVGGLGSAVLVAFFGAWVLPWWCRRMRA